MLKRAAQISLASIGLKLSRIRPSEVPNPIQPWNNDETFKKLAELSGGISLVDPARLHTLNQLALHVKTIKGDLAEVGVYRGGTARLFRQHIEHSDKHLFLFDTFSGMPDTDPERDWHKKGDFSDTSLEGVKRFVGEAANISFMPGFFPETAKPVASRHFCFVHVDVDIYRSVLDCCEFFYPRMTAGGVIVFDDYGFTTCPGAKEAVDGYFADKPEHPLYLPTGQAVVFRLS